MHPLLTVVRGVCFYSYSYNNNNNQIKAASPCSSPLSLPFSDWNDFTLNLRCRGYWETPIFKVKYLHGMRNASSPFTDFTTLRTPGGSAAAAGCRCLCCWHQWQKLCRSADIFPGCRSPPAGRSRSRRAGQPGGSERPLSPSPAGCWWSTAAPDCGWAGPGQGWWQPRQLLDRCGATRPLRCCILARLGPTCNAQTPPGKDWETERPTSRWRQLHSTKK